MYSYQPTGGASVNKVYSIPELQNILSPIFQQNGVKRAILFGSYAKGCPREESDLDLVVDMDGCTHNFAFWGVYEALQEAFSIPVELFEKKDILPGQAAEREIQKTGVIVYDR